MKLCMMSCMLEGLTPQEIVDIAVKCDMPAIDWIGLHGCQAKYLREIAENAGLVIAAHTMLKTKFLKGEKDYLDDFKRSLDDAVTLGAPVMMLPPFPRYVQKSMEDDRKLWTEYYAQAVPLSLAAGVTLTIESTGYVNSPITTGEEVLEVLKQVPGLKLTFDHGNVATADDPDKAYEMLKEYIVHVHLKDWKISDAPTPASSSESLKRCGKYYDNIIIGDGDMNLKKFWDITDANTRSCYVNLETRDFTNTMTPLAAMQKVANYLRDW